ncbi:zinc protease [Hymenobacter daecheongensis DSM 21074]|uniref:Zinc protease n=1 Tax=Hymenobacter daecheongensis DSM 21074 TaxID=1121955 RepID=A0A1M6C9V5_9BACT|nr:pitrilysin family protein [Hymenobacter daecheongensis]SHI57554.1 zinc protease [Hymenobacter daecheongensis DSM 21074]
MTLNFTRLPAVLLAVACCTLTAPAAHAQKKTPVAAARSFSLPYEKFVLENGLEVVLHEDHSDPIVAVATIVHVGSNREKPGKTGFAHFFEHMSFNDSENAPVGANRKLIEEWGGQRNGSTWNDGTQYFEVVPKDAFDKIMWIDSDRLGYMIKTVTAEALAREIQVVKNEKRQNYDNVPYGFTNEVLRKNLYPADHPYNWTVIGSLPDLQAASLADVQEFYRQYYGPNNATLVIAGDINLAETKAKVQRWFGEIKKGPEVKPLAPRPAGLTQTKSLYLEDNFARLPQLQLVFPSIQQYHRDTYALEVLSELLTGNRNSPLYKVIVEEQKLAPNVGSYQYSSELAGEFILQVRANPNTSLQQVHSAIQEGLKRFETQGFSDTELQRIRAKIETNLYAGVESVLSKALQMGRDNEFAGDPAYLTKAAKLAQAVTRADVMRVYNQYLKDKPYVMTSVVPKGQQSLVVQGAQLATVYQEKVVAGVQNEDVGQGQEAVFEKTVTKNDRSEPPFLETPLFKVPPIWTSSLANGLKVYGIDNREIPLVSFDVTIPGGHSLDPLSKAGTASLLAQMLMQGTAQKTPAQLEEAIDLLGATISVSSTNEEIRVQARCLARNFAPTLALVQEILLQPRWDATEFARLKRSLATNLKGLEANPSAVASQNFSKLLYGPNHILSLPVSGTLETTAGITLDDLKAYYNSVISPSGAAVHVVGAIDQNTVAAALKPLETSWAAKAVPMPKQTIPAQTLGGNVYFIDVPDAKQSVLYIGKLALAGTDPDLSKATFANAVLGSGASGRLTQLLRIQKGYTYGAGSSVQELREMAPFIVSTSVRANATGASLQLIRQLLTDYGPTFSQTDVDIAKSKILKGNTLVYESQGAKLGILRRISKFNKPPKFIEDEQQQLMQMGVADFKATIGKYMQEKELVYVVVGDKATQYEEVKKFANGNVTLLDATGKPVK